MRKAKGIATALFASIVGLASIPSLRADVASSPTTQPTTKPAATQPAEPVHVVKKGTLRLDISVDGALAALDPFEVKLKAKSYSGPLTVAKVATHGAVVKKGDLILELETTHYNWAIEAAKNELANARASLKKVELDGELAVRQEALSLRMQEDALKNAQAAVQWFEKVDGPQMLMQQELLVKQQKDSVGDQEDELDQLKKMYQSEELTNATADIVTKRAIRRLDQQKIFAKMQEERQLKNKSLDYPNAKQRVLDNLEQAKFSLESLKTSQEQAIVLRKSSLSSAKMAVEQAEQKFADLTADQTLFSIRAPADGILMYGQSVDPAAASDVKWIKPQERLMPGMVVMRVITPAKMKLEIPLSEAQAFWVEPGLKAKVTPAAFPQTSYDGTCGSIVAVMGKTGAPGVGFTLPIVLPDVDPRLLPGMKVAAKIEAGKVEDALLIPLSTVSGGSVNVKGKDGKSEQRAVVLGRSDGQSVEVKAGLSEGDEVMLGGKK